MCGILSDWLNKTNLFVMVAGQETDYRAGKGLLHSREQPEWLHFTSRRHYHIQNYGKISYIELLFLQQ